jgi:hypothetical protein
MVADLKRGVNSTPIQQTTGLTYVGESAAEERMRDVKESYMGMGRPILDDKLCSCCKTRKPKDQFYGTTKKSGHCKQCQAEQQNARREFLATYLSSHPCVDCGESDPVVLEFDHQSDKTDSLSRMVRNNVTLARLQEEINKCDVRCANCHKRRTARQFGWIYKPAGERAIAEAA